jgi:small ligand-binding sensory domain FIST
MQATQIGAGLSTDPDTEAAATDAAAKARDAIEGAAVDLAVVFTSRPHMADVESLLGVVRGHLDPGHLIGCCAQGVVGTGKEVEEGPGISVWAASLPGTEVESFHLTAADVEAEERITELATARSSVALLLADPMTFPADRMLDLAHGVQVVGGIASGRRSAEDAPLLFEREALDQGAVGALLSGAGVSVCVSQGATPIGPEMVVTGAAENLVLELASKPALEKLSEVIAELEPRERAMAQTGLLIGVVIDENKPQYERGDFLIRGIIGVDQSSGALAVGDRLRVGQTVRFHVRDAESADEDLRQTLERQLAAGTSPAGALLFTCNGRGRNMFPVPDHDAAALTQAFGGAPVAGFFCAGEIGPIGGRNFLHGFTATMALFDS